MTLITSKVCLVGDFAVGKTSVVERYVNNQFSERYLTTVGVKIDTKEIELPQHGLTEKLVLWDVAGADRFGPIEFAYLRGAAGYVFVADGTRSLTLDSALALRDQIMNASNARPSVLLLNKCDLVSAWEIDDARVEALHDHFDSVFRTSAKTGDDVETALTRLAEVIVERELRSGR